MWNPSIKAMNITKLVQIIFNAWFGDFWVCQLSPAWYNTDCSQCLDLIAINFSWLTWQWSTIQQEISSVKLPQPLLTCSPYTAEVFYLICISLCLFVVQSLSCVRLFVTLWNAASQASLSFTISQSLFRLMSVESMMLSNHLILFHPLLLWPSIFPSIKVFSNESALRIRWP